MNELTSNNREKAEVLAEFIHSHGFGNVILHSEIESEIECKRDENQYNTIIGKAKKILLEQHQMGLQNVRGQGYKIVSPDDFTAFSLGFYRRGLNSITKGKNHLDNAPVEHMSAESIDAYRRVHDRAICLEAAMKGASVELKTLAKKPHPFTAASK